MTARANAFAAGMWLAGALGCQGPNVTREEIPEDPVAFIYHAEDEARRRAEAFEKRSSAAARTGALPTVVQLNSFRDYLEEAFGSRADDDLAGRLSLLNPRSSRVTVIESARRGAVPLAWSPQRDRLLFAQWEQGRLQLFELERGSELVSQRTAGREHHPQGCYGPDGRLVAVVIERADHLEEPAAGGEGRRSSTRTASGREALVSRLVLIGPGDAVEPISVGPADGEPACSPDGASVAYVRMLPESRGEIWIHSFGANEPARVLAEGREPAFSPDGMWIVYRREAGRAPTLWRIRRDGTGRTRLGRGSGADEYNPAVSPDGSLVIYESVTDHRHRFFVRRFDGSGDRVLFADGDGTHAVW